MLINELIEKLQSISQEHGNVEILTTQSLHFKYNDVAAVEIDELYHKVFWDCAGYRVFDEKPKVIIAQIGKNDGTYRRGFQKTPNKVTIKDGNNIIDVEVIKCDPVNGIMYFKPIGDSMADVEMTGVL